MRIESNPRFPGSDPVHRPGTDTTSAPTRAEGAVGPDHGPDRSTDPDVTDKAPPVPAEFIGDGVFVPEAVLRRERMRTALEEAHPTDQEAVDPERDVRETGPDDALPGPRLDERQAREAGRQVVREMSGRTIEEAHDPLGTDPATVRKLLS
jgi:hypothetical protein